MGASTIDYNAPQGQTTVVNGQYNHGQSNMSTYYHGTSAPLPQSYGRMNDDPVVVSREPVYLQPKTTTTIVQQPAVVMKVVKEDYRPERVVQRQPITTTVRTEPVVHRQPASNTGINRGAY